MEKDEVIEPTGIFFVSPSAVANRWVEMATEYSLSELSPELQLRLCGAAEALEAWVIERNEQGGD